MDYVNNVISIIANVGVNKNKSIKENLNLVACNCNCDRNNVVDSGPISQDFLRSLLINPNLNYNNSGSPVSFNQGQGFGKCSRCNHDLSEGFKFCPHCGFNQGSRNYLDKFDMVSSLQPIVDDGDVKVLESDVLRELKTVSKHIPR